MLANTWLGLQKLVILSGVKEMVFWAKTSAHSNPALDHPSLGKIKMERMKLRKAL